MSITHAFANPNFQKLLLVKGKNQDSRFAIWRLSRWSPDNAQTTSEDPSGARSSLTWSWREKDCVEMAAFHQLNLYNTQSQAKSGLAVCPSSFKFHMCDKFESVWIGSGERCAQLTNCFYLVLMLPNNLLILDQLPPIYHAAVPAPLNHFHPDSSSIAQPRSYVKNNCPGQVMCPEELANARHIS